MKAFTLFFLLTITVFCASNKETAYQGSTPAHREVREFLGISLTDSIDFIRWDVTIHPDRYELNCQYGLSKANTNGFINEKKVMFSGSVSKHGNYYHLQRGNKVFYIMEINSNLLHLADRNKNLLVGDGGFSYALNNKTPAKSDQFNHPATQSPATSPMAFQGRTPCKEINTVPGRNETDICYKKKWYILLFTDSITGKPAYFLEGGRGYKKETMSKGRWEIIRKNGRIIYKLEINTRPHSLYLLKADDNILFFIDPDGNLLVGDHDFSYTLNRTVDREPKGNN